MPPGREMTVEADPRSAAEGAVVDALRAGDEGAFSALAERHRRELQVHCYRMLGSLEDSEDLVQETFLRAWRRRESFEGRASFRAWLYRIATNACLDWLARHPRSVPSRPPGRSRAVPSEVPWLQPYPDHLLEAVAPSDDEPDVAVVAKETIELAFLVAIQQLPARQRTVLILRDVLGWPANEAASLLESSVASVNSALQRARATLRHHLPARRLDWSVPSDPSEEERILVQRYIDATERADTDAIVAMLREDMRFSMPPQPGSWVGRDAVVAAWSEGGFGSPEFRDIRCRLTWANRQPAVACFLRRPGQVTYEALGLDVLRVEDGAIAEIIAFCPEIFPAFGLPMTLDRGPS